MQALQDTQIQPPLGEHMAKSACSRRPKTPEEKPILDAFLSHDQAGSDPPPEGLGLPAQVLQGTPRPLSHPGLVSLS